MKVMQKYSFMNYKIVDCGLGLVRHHFKNKCPILDYGVMVVTTDFGSVSRGSNPRNPTISGSELEVAYLTGIKHAKAELRVCEEKKSFKVYLPDSATF